MSCMCRLGPLQCQPQDIHPQQPRLATNLTRHARPSVTQVLRKCYSSVTQVILKWHTNVTCAVSPRSSANLRISIPSSRGSLSNSLAMRVHTASLPPTTPRSFAPISHPHIHRGLLSTTPRDRRAC
eukprot:273523-Prorocentrum_minimum.AAC.3